MLLCLSCLPVNHAIHSTIGTEHHVIVILTAVFLAHCVDSSPPWAAAVCPPVASVLREYGANGQARVTESLLLLDSAPRRPEKTNAVLPPGAATCSLL